MHVLLSAAELPFSVEVRLTDHDGRWVAVATLERGPSVGLGRTARDALAASLAPLGKDTVARLLADPGLFGPSRLVV